jgi:hypothetical protein
VGKTLFGRAGITVSAALAPAIVAFVSPAGA